jgi:hypothetical protein
VVVVEPVPAWLEILTLGVALNPGFAGRLKIARNVVYPEPGNFTLHVPKPHWRITGTVNRPVTNERPLIRVTKPVTRYGRITSVSAACNAPVTLYLAKSARRGTDARCVGR